VLHSLATLAALLTAADHWTTYLCLRRPIEGWEVVEANPVAGILFAAAGLLPGLLIDTLITAIAIAFILTTAKLSRNVRYLCLLVMAMTTSYAVVNNLQALSSLGLSPLGVS
jgi:hypothetical protein